MNKSEQMYATAMAVAGSILNENPDLILNLVDTIYVLAIALAIVGSEADEDFKIKGLPDSPGKVLTDIGEVLNDGISEEVWDETIKAYRELEGKFQSDLMGSQMPDTVQGFLNKTKKKEE